MQCVSHYAGAAAIAAALVTISVSCAEEPHQAQVGLSQAAYQTAQHQLQEQKKNGQADKSLGELGDRITEELHRWFGPAGADNDE